MNAVEATYAEALRSTPKIDQVELLQASARVVNDQPTGSGQCPTIMRLGRRIGEPRPTKALDTWCDSSAAQIAMVSRAAQSSHSQWKARQRATRAAALKKRPTTTHHLQPGDQVWYYDDSGPKQHRGWRIGTYQCSNKGSAYVIRGGRTRAPPLHHVRPVLPQDYITAETGPIPQDDPQDYIPAATAQAPPRQQSEYISSQSYPQASPYRRG